MAGKITIEKYLLEDQVVYNMGSCSNGARHSTVIPKKDIAGFLYYILPDVRKQSFEDFPYGESVAMAIKLALDNGKNYINFQNIDDKLKATIADLVKAGVLKENWDNYEIIRSLPAPIVESFSVKVLA
jgi:hypothetical protein